MADQHSNKRRKLGTLSFELNVFVEEEKKRLVDHDEYEQMMADIAKILKEAKQLIVARVISFPDVLDLDLHVPIDINQRTQTRCDRNCR